VAARKPHPQSLRHVGTLDQSEESKRLGSRGQRQWASESEICSLVTNPEVGSKKGRQLHRISLILIEREKIDRDQFERLPAGEDESTVFPEPEAAPETPAPAEEPKRERQPGRPRPFPLPCATVQPPPDPAKSCSGASFMDLHPYGSV
jgi:hypothetical protein